MRGENSCPGRADFLLGRQQSKDTRKFQLPLNYGGLCTCDLTQPQIKTNRKNSIRPEHVGTSLVMVHKQGNVAYSQGLYAAKSVVSDLETTQDL